MFIKKKAKKKARFQKYRTIISIPACNQTRNYCINNEHLQLHNYVQKFVATVNYLIWFGSHEILLPSGFVL
jgi:hypothetical protein